MSTFTPSAELLYQDGSNPKRYCVVASFKETEEYGFVTVSDVQSHREDENGYVVAYTVGGDSSGRDILDADLGTINLLNNGGFVDVEFYDEQSILLGKKRIRTEEAQKDTRPIEER